MKGARKKRANRRDWQIAARLKAGVVLKCAEPGSGSRSGGSPKQEGIMPPMSVPAGNGSSRIFGVSGR